MLKEVINFFFLIIWFRFFFCLLKAVGEDLDFSPAIYSFRTSINLWSLLLALYTDSFCTKAARSKSSNSYHWCHKDNSSLYYLGIIYGQNMEFFSSVTVNFFINFRCHNNDVSMFNIRAHPSFV